MTSHVLAFVLVLGSLPALADVAPPMPRTKDQIRRDRGVDDCQKRKAGDSCTDMKGNPGKCGWFSWWWIPDSNDRESEGADISFAAHVTHCENATRSVKSKAGASVQTVAFKCLVCK